MKTTLLLSSLVLASLSACGPSFDGRWTGDLVQTVSCPGFAAQTSNTMSVDWLAKTNGSSVALTQPASAGSVACTLYGLQQGDTVVFAPASCSSGTNKVTFNGSWTMLPNAQQYVPTMSVLFDFTTETSAVSPPVQCRGRFTGVLRAG